MNLNGEEKAVIKKEPKYALFLGGESDGTLVHMNQHPRFLDVPRTPSPLVVPGKNIPALTKERYFLFPSEIMVDHNAYAIYVIQDWSTQEVLEYLLYTFIKMLQPDAPETH